jgi:hypothetical protein
LQNGNNVLCEVSNDYSDGDTPIVWSVTTRRFPFTSKPAPHTECRLTDGGEIRVSNMMGVSTLSVSYRSNDSSVWRPWHTFGLTGQGNVCTTDGTCAIVLPPEYYNSRLILPNPPKTIDAVTKQQDDKFMDIQFQMTGTGYLQIEWFRPQAEYFSDTSQRAKL